MILLKYVYYYFKIHFYRLLKISWKQDMLEILKSLIILYQSINLEYLLNIATRIVENFEVKDYAYNY